MAKRRRGKLFRNNLMTPELKRLADELRAPGEIGRGLPGKIQAQVQAKTLSQPATIDPEIPAFTGRTEVATYFTKVGGNNLLYQAESWVILRLLLETAGPVAVGARDDVEPVLSGKGILLPTDVEVEFPLAKGNRVFITATAVNRVRFIIQPVPWQEQQTSIMGSLLSLTRKK
jgi:hypothetical protein